MVGDRRKSIFGGLLLLVLFVGMIALMVAGAWLLRRDDEATHGKYTSINDGKHHP